MTFVWTDRDGERRELIDPQPIVVKVEAVALEIDQLVDLLDSEDRSIRDIARKQIAPHQARLDQLLTDLERWNEHAADATRAAAADMAEKIKSLPNLLSRVTLVVDLHDEHEMMLKETAGDSSERAAQLAEPMTELQAQAVTACNVRAPLPPTTSRAEAKAWLDSFPQFRRQRNGDGGWFAWIDQDGHAHRLIDPLPIETEMVEISGDLAAVCLRPVSDTDSAKLYAAVNKTSASWERLEILKADLERFDREAETRDRTECKAYAADWRSKRSK